MEEQYAFKGITGLRNLGNTCYLNTAMQLILHCRKVSHLFLTGDMECDINKNKKEARFAEIYAKLVDGYWTDNCIVNPKGVKNVLGEFYDEYKGFEQHDASEALQRIIDLLHEGYSFSSHISLVIPNNISAKSKNMIPMYNLVKNFYESNYKNNYSKIFDLCYGLFHKKVACQKCGYTNHTFESFNILSLPIDQQCRTLQDCLTLFHKAEILDTSKSWKCDKCNQKSNPIMKMNIWKLPRYLFISLKRFETHLSGHIRKISQPIDYPLENMNFKNFTEEENTQVSYYDCQGIGIHSGSYGGGHYTAYCKNGNNHWYYYDDDSEPTKIRNVKTRNAYVLLYEKK